MYYLDLWWGFIEDTTGVGVVERAIEMIDVLRPLPWEQVRAALSVLKEMHLDWQKHMKGAEGRWRDAGVPFEEIV